MKNKVLKLILALLLIIAVLFTLTACNDEEDDEEKGSKKTADTSSAESTLKAAVNAINDHDATALYDLLDIDALEKTYEEEIDKKEFKSALKDFFKENEDLEIELGKVKKLEKDKELLESLLEVYDSYDEYIEEIEEDYDIKNVEIYTAELEVSDDYADLFEDSAMAEGKDIIYMTKNDGEYRIIYTRFAIELYMDAFGDLEDYDYDDEDLDFDIDDEDLDIDDDNEKDNQNTTEVKENKEAIEYLRKNEGKQKGKVVKEIADYVVENTSSEYALYINYYDKDGLADGFMMNSEDEIEEFKEKIKDSHEYEVEIDETLYGYSNIDIVY